MASAQPVGTALSAAKTAATAIAPSSSIAAGLSTAAGPIGAMLVAQQFFNALNAGKKAKITDIYANRQQALDAGVDVLHDKTVAYAEPANVSMQAPLSTAARARMPGASFDPTLIRQKTQTAQNAGDTAALIGLLPKNAQFSAGNMVNTNKFTGQPITNHAITADMYGLPSNFGSNRYMQLNPDVAKSGMSAAEHYLKYGKAEGRNYLKPATPAAPVASTTPKTTKPAAQIPAPIAYTPPKIKKVQAQPAVDVNKDPYSSKPQYEDIKKLLGDTSMPDFLQGLDEAQKRSAIATQGVFGGGAGQDETKYYLRDLLDRFQGGNVKDVGRAGLLPVEGTFLQSQGLPINGSIDAFLRALRTNYELPADNRNSPASNIDWSTTY